MTEDHLRPRHSTNESLRTERRHTDAHLAQTFAAIKNVADDVVAEARHKADAVLTGAREREDKKLAADGERGNAVEGRHQQRAYEDAALTAQRGGADEAATAVRLSGQLALASFLEIERHDTDLRLEIERARADKLAGSSKDFMAMVSHDLRTLLGGIALSADLVKTVAAAEEPVGNTVKYADSILRLSARMNRLIGDLMDVASIEAGKLAIVRERADAGLLVQQTVEAFQSAATARSIALTCKIGEDLGAVEFDPERILQVLANLVSNALKFTPRGGQISVGVESVDQDLCFAVSDSGEGVPADRLSRIFERFYQTHDHDRRGLGLGLFIVESVVEAHGGKVWVESTEGKGSTFLFTVPRRAPDDVSPGASAACAPMTS